MQWWVKNNTFLSYLLRLNIANVDRGIVTQTLRHEIPSNSCTEKRRASQRSTTPQHKQTKEVLGQCTVVIITLSQESPLSYYCTMSFHATAQPWLQGDR